MEVARPGVATYLALVAVVTVVAVVLLALVAAVVVRVDEAKAEEAAVVELVEVKASRGFPTSKSTRWSGRRSLYGWPSCDSH